MFPFPLDFSPTARRSSPAQAVFDQAERDDSKKRQRLDGPALGKSLLVLQQDPVPPTSQPRILTSNSTLTSSNASNSSHPSSLFLSPTFRKTGRPFSTAPPLPVPQNRASGSEIQSLIIGSDSNSLCQPNESTIIESTSLSLQSDLSRHQ